MLLHEIGKLAKLEHFFADFRGGGANVPSAPSESATDHDQG